MNIFQQNLDIVWQKAICRRRCTFYLALFTEFLYFAYFIQGSGFFGTPCTLYFIRNALYNTILYISNTSGNIGLLDHLAFLVTPYKSLRVQIQSYSNLRPSILRLGTRTQLTVQLINIPRPPLRQHKSLP